MCSETTLAHPQGLSTASLNARVPRAARATWVALRGHVGSSKSERAEEGAGDKSRRGGVASCVNSREREGAVRLTSSHPLQSSAPVVYPTSARIDAPPVAVDRAGVLPSWLRTTMELLYSRYWTCTAAEGGNRNNFGRCCATTLLRYRASRLPCQRTAANAQTRSTNRSEGF